LFDDASQIAMRQINIASASSKRSLLPVREGAQIMNRASRRVAGEGPGMRVDKKGKLTWLPFGN
jgi:hypothetical protein